MADHSVESMCKETRYRLDLVTSRHDSAFGIDEDVRWNRGDGELLCDFAVLIVTQQRMNPWKGFLLQKFTTCTFIRIHVHAYDHEVIRRRADPFDVIQLGDAWGTPSCPKIQ